MLQSLKNICAIICFNIAFALWTILIASSGMLVFSLKYSTPSAFAKIWAKGCLWFLKHLAGIDYEIRGQQYIPTYPALIASAHQSTFEALLFILILEKPTYVVKKELLRIPLISFYIKKLDMIIINRAGGHKTLLQILKKAQTKKEHTIIIFPDGTRRKPYDHPHKMPSGVLALYKTLSLPLHPVALNSGVCWPKGNTQFIPGKIIIEFFPPIKAGQDIDTLKISLKEILDTNSDRLANEAYGQ